MCESNFNWGLKFISFSDIHLLGSLHIQIMVDELSVDFPSWCYVHTVHCWFWSPPMLHVAWVNATLMQCDLYCTIAVNMTMLRVFCYWCICAFTLFSILQHTNNYDVTFKQCIDSFTDANIDLVLRLCMYRHYQYLWEYSCITTCRKQAFFHLWG